MNTIQRVNGVKMEWLFLSFSILSFWYLSELEGWRDQMISVWCLWYLWKLSSERKLMKALRSEHHGQAQPYSFLCPLACRESHPAALSAEVWTEGKIVNLGSNLRSPENKQDITSCGLCPVGTGQRLQSAECVWNEVVLGQVYLHCTPALPSKMDALSLDSRPIFT